MFNYKRLLALTLALLLSVTVLVSCGEGESVGEDSTVYYTVTFDFNDGREADVRQVASGATVDEPIAPTRDGFVFGGWSHNSLIWDFDLSTVSENITLKAKWISATAFFEYEPIDGTTARITGLKRKEEQIRVPSVIGEVNGASYTVTAIGADAFSALSSDDVTEIVLPETVVSVGERAFRNSKGISVTVKGALTEIGEYAFENCDGLKEIKLGEGIQKISAYGFAGCVGLKEIRLPQSVKTVEESAFTDCTALVSVTMYAEGTTVEESAFRECDGLTAIYLYGTEEQIDCFTEEKIGNMNDAFLNAKIFLYAEAEPDTETVYDGYWYRDDNGKIRVW